MRTKLQARFGAFILFVCLWMRIDCLEYPTSNVLGFQAPYQESGKEVRTSLDKMGFWTPNRILRQNSIFQSPRLIAIATKSSPRPMSTTGNNPPRCDVRLLMFVFYASLGCLMPYIPMYYKYLGIGSGYIGLLGAITPAVTFVVSPLWVFIMLHLYISLLIRSTF